MGRLFGGEMIGHECFVVLNSSMPYNGRDLILQSKGDCFSENLNNRNLNEVRIIETIQ